MGVETWLLVAAVVVLAWAYSRWRHSYWSSRGVPSPPTLPFLGHLHYIFKGPTWIVADEDYQKYRNAKLYGGYECFSPVLRVADPDILKNILVKDFEHFVDRRVFGQQESSIMGEMLSNKAGDEWKALRSLMSPTFSSGKMRSMFSLICEKADNLVSFSLKQAANNSPVDMKDNFGRFTMDTIASCAFGIECNSLSDVKPLFVEKAETFFNIGGLKMVKFFLMLLFPKVYSLLGFKVDSPEIGFFKEIVDKTVAARRKGEKRGDFLDLLLEAEAVHDNDSNTSNKAFNDKTLVAQSVLFLVAGYDTTASTLAFASYLLSKHPQHQHRLRQEMLGLLKEHGDVTYQGIMEAKFLDACLNETLRLYPPGIMGERKCTKQYRIPGTEVTLLPGQLVQFPIWSLHHDPRYWPDAEEFQPERFLPENRSDINSFTHMPFGMGPRNCIAMRFALMEAKVALAKLVLAADMKLEPGYEMVLQRSSFILRPDKGVQILLTPLKDK